MKYYLFKLKNKVLGLINIFPFLHRHFSGMATIFMLHRVHPFESSKLPPNENMKISPEFLDNFIIKLKSKGFEVISLDHLYALLEEGKKVEKKIIFTLDDGYKDNFELAYPIFKKHNVPFTIYVTTSMPEKKAILWWYIVEDLLLKNDQIILNNSRILSCKTKKEKINAFFKIRAMVISFEPDNFEIKLKELFNAYDINWNSNCEDLAMSWEHIITLSKDELVTIASHTKNHFALNRLPDKKIIDEILDANHLIELKTNKKVMHFSYPFGSANEIGEREINMLNSMNFKTATTTRNGNVYMEHINHLNCLPRIMLTEDFKLKDIGNFRLKKIVSI